jgi:dihydrofolate reductase
MRKIITFDHVTADGYFATTDGTLDWVVADEQASQWAMKRSGEIDAVLFGRKTYEMFAAFWPDAYEQSKRGAIPEAPHGPGRPSEFTRDIATFLHRVRKVVYSRTLKSPTWNNTHVVRELDPRDVEKLKREAGGGIMIFGSGSIASALTRNRLIDEYQLLVSPIVLGTGRKLIDGVPGRPVELVEVKPFDSGVVLMRYTAK